MKDYYYLNDENLNEETQPDLRRLSDKTIFSSLKSLKIIYNNKSTKLLENSESLKNLKIQGMYQINLKKKIINDKYQIKRPESTRANVMQFQYNQLFEKDDLFKKSLKGKLTNLINKNNLISLKSLNAEVLILFIIKFHLFYLE